MSLQDDAAPWQRGQGAQHTLPDGDPDEEGLFEAPPVPFRLPSETEPMARRVDSTPRRLFRSPTPEPADEALPAPVEVDFRDTLPPYLPEGYFNPGVAIAWVVSGLCSLAVLTWHAGPDVVIRWLVGSI